MEKVTPRTIFIDMLFISFFIIISVQANFVKVKTSVGKIIGVKHEGYSSFTGIPYCIVDFRNHFGDCTPVPNFTIPFEAYNNSHITCQQMKDSKSFGTLQCLRLNVYVPESKHVRLPVVVWFHGESFWYGDANDYHSSYLVKEDIIFVSVNFRLGPYGFLCAKDSAFPGNRGMKDQIEALKWVQSHIEAFNGDPITVTIAGSGYGGGYVNLHLYRTFSNGLFDKAIIQSGSIFTNQFFVPIKRRRPIEIASHLGHLINRYTTNRDVLAFLSEVSFGKLFSTSNTLSRFLGVCVESKIGNGKSNIVTKNPFDLEFGDNNMHFRILIGHNSMDMLSMFADNNTSQYYDEAGDIIYKVLEKSFTLSDSKLHDLAEIIKTFYLGGKGYNPSTLLYLAEAMSDFYIKSGIEMSINKLVNAGATVFKYQFSYTGASKYRSIRGSGASLGEELKFLLDGRLQITGPEQEKVRSNMLKMWANFIKYGNPTPSDKPVAWTPLHGEARPYLNIDVNLTMMKNSFVKKNSFWDLIWRIYKKKSKTFLVY